MVLGARLGVDTNLISISMDPRNDTPASLTAWGKKLGRRPAWTLLTGDKDQIDELGIALVGAPVEPGMHSPTVFAVGQIGGHGCVRTVWTTPKSWSI